VDASGTEIVFASAAEEPFARARHLWAVSREGGPVHRLPFGVANRVAFGDAGQVVIARHAADPARWKRYRGGTAGRLWIDRAGTGEFERLAPVEANLASPQWLAGRIYFISDHEGIGNLYSCLPDGTELQRHSHHEDFYARNAASDGRQVVYHAGGNLYCYRPGAAKTDLLQIKVHSPRAQRRRRFVDADRFMQEFSLHPKGHALALTVRGKLFTMANWEGAVLQHGIHDGVRYRLSEWLNDGQRLITVADTDGEEALEVHAVSGATPPIRFTEWEIGRATGLAVSPTHERVAVRNHRFELLLADLEDKTCRILDRSDYHPISGVAWSPDGRWLAYSCATNERTLSIKIADCATGDLHTVTHAEFSDVAPAWDPEGKYLYFLSSRVFNPVYDALQFELGFPEAMRPMLVLLRRDLPNPFIPVATEDEPKKEEEKTNEEEKPGESKEKPPQETLPIEIDFGGIQDRVLQFPCKESRFGKIVGIKGKVLYTRYAVEGALQQRWDKEKDPKGTLLAWSFGTFKEDSLVSGIGGFDISRDLTTMAYSANKRLRVVKAGEAPPDENKDKGSVHDHGRSKGWIDLGRIKVATNPALEWRQMYREAWRLQRDHFWTEDMSGVDWQRVYERYFPLLDRIAARSEFSDLTWEMQGELGTSHAYEMGGDYRKGPQWLQGHLGADFEYDAAEQGFRITHIARGDSWEPAGAAPLLAPGVNATVGELLLAIGGQRLQESVPPSHLLVNQGGQEIQLELRGKDGVVRTVVTRTLNDETALRYREWVRSKREYVHAQTGGQIGYVHVPDMSPRGYAEFHRGYLAELQHLGLIIDVRYNGGGHVSQLLLEKLARRRLGYDVSRWGTPEPYPHDSVLGPLVALTNENAGSDGDIFCHAFKMMGLGKLVGMRTWGGVIGISPSQRLVDGGLTTQPEHSFWFQDVGWQVENYGTEPDIEVDITPQDYRDGRDPQLDKAIEVALQDLKQKPPKLPDFGPRPRRDLPRLPAFEPKELNDE